VASTALWLQLTVAAHVRYFVDSGNALAIINGTAAASWKDGDVVLEYGNGDYFGELSLRANQPRAATVVAASGLLKVLQLDSHDFDWCVRVKIDRWVAHDPVNMAST
jgi:CRP-like cAMP-binding protein